MANVVGTPNADNLNGTSGPDDMTGLKGDDYIFGFEGDDFFNWSTGVGNNSTGRPTVESSDGADSIDGGAGVDRFRVFSDLHYQLFGRNSDLYNMQSQLVAGPDGSARFVLTQQWDNFGASPNAGVSRTEVTLRNIELFSYTGSKAPEPASTYPVVYTATDIITVGDLSSTSLTGLLLFDLGTGNDQLDASLAVNRIAALGGAGNDLLRGGAADDELQGGEGDDQLSGGGGFNTLIGGAGNDTYFSENRFDSILEANGEGSDSIITKQPYYISSVNVEVLQYVGTGDFVGIGNEQSDYLIGATGNDYLIGRGGDDFLRGGPGNNTLQGGLGNDFYTTESAGDSLVEFANEGIDSVETVLSTYTLRENFENLAYIGTTNFTGVGNAADNVIRGGAGDDVLEGLDGKDTLVGLSGTNTLKGGSGDDLYRVSSNSDVIVEAAGGGLDQVELSGTDFTLSANVENLQIVGSAGATIRGNDAANVITGGIGNDNLAGFAGNDVLNGNSGSDSLSGYDGDDILTGGAGGDELSGGAGADRFVFDVLSGSSQDLVHDFSRSEGDRFDISQILHAIGYSGSNPVEDGILQFENIQAYGSSGTAATRILIDADGAGPMAAVSLAVVLGSMNAVEQSDFILI